MAWWWCRIAPEPSSLLSLDHPPPPTGVAGSSPRRASIGLTKRPRCDSRPEKLAGHDDQLRWQADGRSEGPQSPSSRRSVCAAGRRLGRAGVGRRVPTAAWTTHVGRDQIRSLVGRTARLRPRAFGSSASPLTGLPRFGARSGFLGAGVGNSTSSCPTAPASLRPGPPALRSGYRPDSCGNTL